MTTIYFFHGALSSPQSQKIQAMKRVAENHGYTVDIPNHADIRSADDRIASMKARADLAIGNCYLVGSSMGGYVATALSQILKPRGLFLLAPAFYMTGYNITNPQPYADKISIIHGWHDDIVPLANVFKFAETHQSALHIVNDSHNLRASIPQILDLFRLFLNEAKVPSPEEK